jgi:hypothetical protein
MRGTILGVHNGRGVVIAPDDRRLEFSMAEWRSPGSPTPGQSVDYVEENGEARAVFSSPPLAGAPLPAAQPPAPTSSAMTLSIIALVCLALGLVFPVLPTVAALILGAMGAGQARETNDSSALILGRIAWIGAIVMLALGVLVLLAVFSFFGLWGAAYLWN